MGSPDALEDEEFKRRIQWSSCLTALAIMVLFLLLAYAVSQWGKAGNW